MTHLRQILVRSSFATALFASGAAIGVAVERRAWDFIEPGAPLEGAVFLAGWLGLAALSVLPAVAATAFGAALLRRLRAERREVERLAREGAIIRTGVAAMGNVVLVWPVPPESPDEVAAVSDAASDRYGPLDPHAPAPLRPWLLSGGRLLSGEPNGTAAPVAPSDAQALPQLLAHLESLLAPADFATLRQASRCLRREGTAFELTLDALSGRPGPRRLRASGHREPCGAVGRLDILWLVDETPAILIEEAEAQTRRAAARTRELKALLDSVQVPLWRRGADGGIADWNAAYAAIAGTSGGGSGEAARPADLLDAGQASRASAGAVLTTHQVVAGVRRLFAVHEQSIGAIPGSLAGHALDITALEQAQRDLDRHIQAHQDVLQNLAIGIEIYGPDRRLEFRNTAYEQMTGLPPEWLDSRPEMGEVLSRLRDRRLLPEDREFGKLRKARLALFTALQAQVEALHLPDGRIWRMATAPHPFGGVLVSYEDVSDKVGLERSYNALVTFQREVLESLYEGIAVFGPDGRLKLYNPAFASIWQLTPMMLADQMHVQDFRAHIQHFFPPGSTAFSWRDWAVERVHDPYPDKGTVIRDDGAVVDYACVPLREGSVLLSFSDETPLFAFEARLEHEARLANRAALLAASALSAAALELPQLLEAALLPTEPRALTTDLFGVPAAFSPSVPLALAAEIVALLPGLCRDRPPELEAGPSQPARTAAGERNGDEAFRSLPARVLAELPPLLCERARRLGVIVAVEVEEALPSLPVDQDRLRQALFHAALDVLAESRPGDRLHLIAADAGGVVEIGLHRRPREEGAAEAYGPTSRGSVTLGLPTPAAVAAIAAAAPYPLGAADAEGGQSGGAALPLFPFLEETAPPLAVKPPARVFFPGAGLGETLLEECAGLIGGIVIERDGSGGPILRIALTYEIERGRGEAAVSMNRAIG